MCITQCKFFILLYCIVLNCELCITQSVNCMYILTLLQTIDKRLTDDRPDLSSERAPQIGQDCNFQRKKNLWSKVPDWARHQDLLTDCQSQCNADADCRLSVSSLTTRKTPTVISAPYSRELLQRCYNSGIYWNCNSIDFMVAVDFVGYLLN
jgi:hypothetical protein